MCNAGLAGTHIGLSLHMLVAAGIPLAAIADHVMKYILQKKYGKVQRTWIPDNRLKDDNLSSFAGTILALVPIIVCVLKEMVAPLDILDRHVLCFSIMSEIIDILKLGAHTAVHHIERLSRLIDMHAELFAAL